MVLDNMLTPSEWDTYEAEFRRLSTEFDGVAVTFAYLRCTPDLCCERIRKRGRPEEATLALGYLEKLHQRHEDWLMSDTNTVVLDASLQTSTIVTTFQKTLHSVLSEPQEPRQSAGR